MKIQQHNLPCHTRTKAEAIQAATALLVQQGLKVTLADTIVGLVQAESEESHDVWTRTYTKRFWQINVRSEITQIERLSPEDQAKVANLKHPTPLFIIATAKTTTQTRNVFGATLGSAEHYYDDKAHRDWEWYWGVRDGLESVCNAKVVITTRKVN